MTITQGSHNAYEVASPPANDNRAPDLNYVRDLVPPSCDDEATDVVRRAERLANTVVIAMAVCLVLVPVTCLIYWN